MIKSTSFNNILLHFRSGDQDVILEGNVNDLLMEETNSFEGWECWAGIQNITIDNEGEVWRAICRQGGSLGNIHDGFEIPKNTVICRKKKCNCAADLQLSKSLPEFRKKIRAGQSDGKDS